MEKKNIVVLFGGQSSEHVVSCMSVQNVAANINEEKYNVILVGITEDGHWVKVDSLSQVKDDTWRESKTGAVLSPDAKEKCLIVTENGSFEKIPVDVVFPVLHGLYGEDGTVQGILELAKIPYVGCGVLASAVSMDKLSTKRMVSGLGICQAAYVSVMKAELKDMDAVIAKIEKEIPYPVFVKPSNAGSSRGVTRADNREELITGLREAADNDRRILVEEMIVGREIECGVFGDGDSTKASGVGEILAAAEFYDFDAKYYNAESKTVVDPELPDGATERVREAAVKIFNAVDGYGLSRVDFFVKADGTVVFNEINTLPGFTAISMYPMLWEARGVDKRQLIDDLIDHAFRRYERYKCSQRSVPEAVRTVQNDISGEIYMTKDILVRVRGVQTIGEEEDTVEMITPGTYYVKNGKQYLIYDESLDETGTPTHNTVKVMENRIEVMKRGLVESHMIFEPGRRTTANYRTPMGLFLMGITTSLLEVEEDEESILLRIKYSMEMNGEYAFDCNTEILASSRKEEVLGIPM